MSINGDSSNSSTQIHKKKIALLDDDDDLSETFLKILHSIFVKFSKEAREKEKKARQHVIETRKTGRLDEGVQSHLKGSEDISKCILTEEEFDNFTKIVNQGEIMSKTSKEEIKEYLDVDDDGQLTYAGFCEMYHLQTGSDPQETWKDLEKLGYKDQLLVAKDRE